MKTNIKMRLIDFLSDIANGKIEEKTRFLWEEHVYEVEITLTKQYFIYDITTDYYKNISLNDLNDEIEIIEEPKKIERLELVRGSDLVDLTDFTGVLSNARRLKKGEIRNIDKELALRINGYLIGHYKTHEETIINSQEIEAINYILDENERLEQQCKKQKEIIDKLEKKIKVVKQYDFDKVGRYELLNILKEVSE